jgi:hypothetical protein
MEPYRVMLRFADGRVMLLALDATEEQRRSLSPVMYLEDEESEEVIALLKAWFPAAFSLGPRQAGSSTLGGW